MARVCKMGMHWCFILFILLIANFLSSCAHSLTKQASAEVRQACQSNALLQKYHCSFNQVAAAANANDADAQYALGYMYYYGIDTSENMDSAKVWMRRAAAQGQPQAIQALQMLQIPLQTTEVINDAVPKLTPVDKTPLIQKTTGAKHRKIVNNSTNDLPDQLALQDSYSIQLVASVSLPRLREFVIRNHLQGKAGYYKACINGTPWYMLIYGHYPNKTKATQALRSLPASLQKHHPWLKSYNTIQSQIANGNTC